jgi:rare lipoprotein A
MTTRAKIAFTCSTLVGAWIASMSTVSHAAEEVTFSGNASWYGIPFHGRKTASGQIYDMNKLTAAHKTLPFFTKVLVENPKNGKSIFIVVNDRGPFVKSRVMDLSRKGAEDLGYLSRGTAQLDFTVLPVENFAGSTAKRQTNSSLKDLSFDSSGASI